MMYKAVVVTMEQLVLPTYPEAPYEAHPMFAENRVHQRSSGNPYPSRVVLNVDRSHLENVAYQAIRIENDYLSVVVLPQLGGRIYSAYDKVNGYDFFYKQHVIKPALIGLLGSWISGGVEFNWPCHHRPSTYMPCDYYIERTKDGAATVWLSEHEPLDRMKGMVGIRLTPNSSLLETHMRLYNRTPLRHSFLWWENAAVPVNEQYRLFFPPDVQHVQFHYRKNVTTYPIAQGQYNGIRLGKGTDISYHKNTRQPTSYFAAASRYDFFGGYDEGKQAGVVHVANCHTAPGKKMFTWAYNQLSRSWEKALTDIDGAYAELMAGSYTNNQPDFSWLEPYETKTFCQSWYPIGAMGVPDCANEHAAVRLGDNEVCFQAVYALNHAKVILNGKAFVVDSLYPGKVVRLDVARCTSFDLIQADGTVLLSYKKKEEHPLEMPEALPSNPTLDQIITAQDGYLAGVHVQQYRDPAIWPDAYWTEALQREPEHVPSLTALAYFRYQKGRYEEAAALAKRAWLNTARWNDRPESGKLQFLLGLLADNTQQDEDAYAWFYRASWCHDVITPAMIRIACIDGRRKDYAEMADHARQALTADSRCGYAKALLALALWHRNDTQQAQIILAEGTQADPLDHLLRWIEVSLFDQGKEAFFEILCSNPLQTCMDVAWDLKACGESEMAEALLAALPQPTVDTVFPFRLEEEQALKAHADANPADTAASFGLGCLLYNMRRYEEAAACYQQTLQVNPAHVGALRGMAIACFSHLNQKEEALPLLQKALALQPQDQQLIYETAYVMLRVSCTPQEKAAFIRQHMPESPRDDLLVELVQAENLAGRYEEALRILSTHSFVPCEGGEHAIAEQFMFAHYALGRTALQAGNVQTALQHFGQAQTLPNNLGAGLWNEVLKTPHLYYQAVCLAKLGKQAKAREIWQAVADQKQDYFSDMHLPELPCWQAMALRQLGAAEMGRQLAAHHFEQYRQAREKRDAGFYRTTPFFLCYIEQPAALRKAVCDYQQGMACLAVGDSARATKLLQAGHQGDVGHLYAAFEARQ